jgi:hypothetical protein
VDAQLHPVDRAVHLDPRIDQRLAAFIGDLEGEMIAPLAHDFHRPVEDGRALMRLLPLGAIAREGMGPRQRPIDRVPIMRRNASDRLEVERIDHFMHGGVPQQSM